MKLKHPVYGDMIVPDSPEEIMQEIQISKAMLFRSVIYCPVIQAYMDMLDLAQDLYRRNDDEDAI